MKTEKKLRIFEKELELIVDDEARTFVKHALLIAPEYFWTVPSSLRYHPKDERKKGGRVLHARRVARLSHSIARVIDLASFQRDAMVAAGILHDICARGLQDVPSSLKAVENHGELVIALLWARMGADDLHLSDLRDWGYPLTRCILTHMGKHGPSKPMTDLEWLFHYIDAVVAQEYVKVKPL